MRTALRALIVIAATLAALTISHDLVAAQRVGLIETLKNAAFGIPPDAGRGPKSLRDDVVFRETLETASESALLLRFVDDTKLTMGESAVVMVDEFVYDPARGAGNMVISLSVGAFRFVSGKMPKGGVVIQTPSVVIGIRGTELLILVAADGTTLVSVLRGAVELLTRNLGTLVTLLARQSVSVMLDGRAGPVTDGVKGTGDSSVDVGIAPEADSPDDSGPPGVRDALNRPLPTMPPIQAILPAIRPMMPPPVVHVPVVSPPSPPPSPPPYVPHPCNC